MRWTFIALATSRLHRDKLFWLITSKRMFALTPECWVIMINWEQGNINFIVFDLIWSVIKSTIYPTGTWTIISSWWAHKVLHHCGDSFTPLLTYRAPEFTPGFSGVRVTRSLVLYVCFVDRCLSFCTFLLVIVLSVLRYTDSDCPFGIFKFFF
jgi:hypothetical protein